ncbi:hypothetical protein J6590_077864 [Homalodisca vitripennis]|nr:hypothetical protein J6590_077864 [Homalodisca vitripennis]
MRGSPEAEHILQKKGGCRVIVVEGEISQRAHVFALITMVAKLETNAMCGNIDSNGPVVPMIRDTKNATVHFLFSSGWTRNCDRLDVPHVYYRVCVQLFQDVQ